MNGYRWIGVGALLVPLFITSGCRCLKHCDASLGSAKSDEEFGQLSEIVFAIEPEDQIGKVGTPISFRVSVNEPPGLRNLYQWSWNGQAITGATNAEYRIASVQTNNAGFYSCLVTAENRAGQEIEGRSFSKIAELLVYEPGSVIVYGTPLVTSAANSSCPGDSAGYVLFRKPKSPYGWEVENRAITATARDPNRANTRVTYVGYAGASTKGCGTNVVAIGPNSPSTCFRFAIYFPRGTAVPTGPYPIHLENFKP